MRTLRHTALGTGLSLLIVSTAAAQPAAPASSPSARWAPWIGCWQVSEESVEDSARLLAELTETPSTRGTTKRGTTVCVAPSDDGAGVSVTTRVNDQPVLSETMIADGAQRPVDEPGCKGWQKADWSNLGARVFARAELTCGEQPVRTVSGMSAMVAGPMWLDIQMIESQGRKSLRVRRYERVNQRAQSALPLSRDTATVPLGKKLSLAEISEASKNVPTEVLQAAVLELGTGGYDLKAKQLLELDAAGVPDSVIDLMVAMSYPKRFVVERASASTGGFGGFGMLDSELDLFPYFGMWPYVGMFPYMSDMYYASSPFYRARYSPFGYGYWGYFDPYDFRYYGDRGFVVVDSGGTSVPVATGEGRVVDGRGYTRIRRNEPAPPVRVSDGNGGWTTSSAGSSGGSSSSGSGSSGVSSGGYSGGGSSSGGDRVAVPRPPGN